jgi:hypothetical protein
MEGIAFPFLVRVYRVFTMECDPTARQKTCNFGGGRVCMSFDMQGIVS